jgi:alkylated DNA nucleotide flippase Atl1
MGAIETKVARVAARSPAARVAQRSPRLRAEPRPESVADASGARKRLPTPEMVAETIAAIPRGEVMTMRELRERLAERYGVRGCAASVGISVQRLVRTAAALLRRGQQAPWPVWRLVRDDGTLHPGWPLDARFRASVLRNEGRAIVWTGHGWRVLGLLTAAG